MIGEVIGEFIGTMFIEFIWGTLLNFVGGTIRWIYGTIWRTIAGKPKYEFEEYINGPKNSNDWFDKGHGLVNSVIGLFIIIFLIISLIYLL